MQKIITFAAVALLTMATASTHKILSPDNSNEWLEPVTDEQYNNLQ